MDIAKLHDLKLTDSGPISHHHRQNRSYSSVGISGSLDNEGILVINRNLNYYNNQDQDVSHLQQLQQDYWGVGRDEQEKNGRSNHNIEVIHLHISIRFFNALGIIELA